MSNVFYKALPGGLTNLFLVLGIELFTYAFDFPVEQLYSISAVTVLFVGLLVLYQVCRPFDWKRRTVWGVMTVAALVCVFRRAFQHTAPDAADRAGSGSIPSPRPARHASGSVAV